jgi:hypothetical protein
MQLRKPPHRYFRLIGGVRARTFSATFTATMRFARCWSFLVSSSDFQSSTLNVRREASTSVL